MPFVFYHSVIHGLGFFELTEFEIAGLDCISIGILASISVSVSVRVGASAGVSVSGTLLMALLCIATLLPLLTIQV